MVTNYLAGRQNADQERAATMQNQLGQQQLKLREEESQLRQSAFSAEQQKAVATKLMLAAQHGLQSATPKVFIEQNFPELAQLAGSKWATADDNAVKASLQDLIGKLGPEAGVGPAQPRGQGAMYKYTGPDGKPIYGAAEDVRGQPVYQETADRQPPSGYRWGAGGRLEPIPGGPADPNTPNTRDDTRIFAKADKLRDEFNTQSKDFIAVGDSYNVVKQTAKDNSAAGDLSMIFAFMKMLDPTSVVRETEFANAQNAAGIPERVQNTWNKALNGERLSPAQREDFIRQAKNLYETRKSRNEAVKKRYIEIAKRNKVNPDDVVGDMGAFEDEAQAAPAANAPVPVASEQEYEALPPGTQYIAPDGSTRTKL
jgi:hypothetical protein